MNARITAAGAAGPVLEVPLKKQIIEAAEMAFGEVPRLGQPQQRVLRQASLTSMSCSWQALHASRPGTLESWS